MPKKSLQKLSWTPPDVIPQSLFELVYRLLSDYHPSWLTSNYSTDPENGFQQLGLGILTCLALDFEIKITELTNSKNGNVHPDGLDSN